MTLSNHSAMVSEHLHSRSRQEKARLSELHKKIASQQEEIATQQARCEELRGVIDELQATIGAGFAAVPSIKTQSWLRNQTISGIEQEREKAYRVRNYAMRTLLAVDTIHRPRDTNGRLCTCGLPAHDCRVNRALEDERHYLYEWENRQRDNAHKRIEDFLPDDHPDHRKFGYPI